MNNNDVGVLGGRPKDFKTNPSSARQQIIALGVGESIEFSIDRSDYIASLVYRIGRSRSRRYMCNADENRVRVTRVM